MLNLNQTDLKTDKLWGFGWIPIRYHTLTIFVLAQRVVVVCVRKAFRIPVTKQTPL